MRAEGKGIDEIAKETKLPVKIINEQIRRASKEALRERGRYYKAIYFYKMGYTYEEIAEILNKPIPIIRAWIEKGEAPVGALKIPKGVIMRRVKRYEYPILTNKNLILYSALIGTAMGDGMTVIAYWRRMDKEDTYGEFEFRLTLEVKDYDFTYIVSKILSEVLKRDITPKINRKLWKVEIKNKDLACFLAEHATGINIKLKRVVEASEDAIKAWLYFFKLSEGRKGRLVTNTNKEYLIYFRELERKIGIETEAGPVWHHEAWQLYVPKKSDIIVGGHS